MIRLFRRALKTIDRAYVRFMIVRHGFWFVDIPRTSSSSIRSELGKRFGKAHGKRNIIEKEHSSNQFLPDHMPAREMRDFLGHSKWNRIFTFTVVRNPWDRICSMYHYRRKMGNIPGAWGFRDYVLALGKASLKNEYFSYHGYRYGASKYVLGEDGEIIVDFIAKYENRLHDLQLIASRLNFRELGQLHIQSAAPRNRNYSEFYDSETREIIRSLYKEDIELFDYKFDEKA